jgi:hypothetical protein
VVCFFLLPTGCIVLDALSLLLQGCQEAHDLLIRSTVSNRRLTFFATFSHPRSCTVGLVYVTIV